MKLSYKRISDLGRVITGKTPPTSRQEYFGGEYMFVTPSDLQYDHYYCRSTERTLSEEAKTILANQFIPADSVMFTCIGATIGKCGIAPAECLTNQQINSIVANEDTDPKFLYYLLCQNIESVKGIGGGSATPIVSKSKFEDIVLRVPSFHNQQRIASILSTYDDLIENNRRRMALLEDAARQVYQEWFVRLRFPGHEHTRIVDGVPEGWERAPLESALVLQRGFDLPSQARQEGTVPIYASTGVNGYHSTAKVKAPGLATGRSGSLGMVHYIHEDFWPLNTTLWVKEFRRVSPLFAYFLLSILRLDQYNGGVSVPTLDRKVVHKIEVVVPNDKIQALFGDYVLPMFTQLRNLGIYNDKLRTARDLLLPRLMSGEISV